MRGMRLMSRPAKGPRLYLRPATKTRAAFWIIRDGERQISNGRSADDLELAQADFRNYLNGYRSRRPIDIKRESAELRRLSRIGNVYFISCDRPEFPIKIGFAIDVRVRMRALQGAMPWPLEVLLTIEGDVDKERELHRQFKHLRMEGEWFSRDADIMKYIERVKAVSIPYRKRRA